jgi:Delta3-Delta2-enoyl-CoA isomerase
VIAREQRGDVLILRMAEDENLFDGSFVDAFNRELDAIEAESSVCALVLTGSGKFFSNGFDLTYLGSLDGDGLAEFVLAAQRLVARVLTFPLPTVAAVNGHAFGIAAMLALAHDQRVMRADRGWWCLPEIDLGLPLQPFMAALLRARLSDLTASEALLSGRRYSGADAVSAGIVHEAVPQDVLLDRATTAGAARAGKSSDVTGVLKRDLYAPVIAALGGAHVDR